MEALRFWIMKHLSAFPTDESGGWRKYVRRGGTKADHGLPDTLSRKNQNGSERPFQGLPQNHIPAAVIEYEASVTG